MIQIYRNKLNYLKHLFLLVQWNQNLNPLVNLKINPPVLEPIILTSNQMDKKLLYQVKLKILKFCKSQGQIQSSNQQLLDSKVKMSNFQGQVTMKLIEI